MKEKIEVLKFLQLMATRKTYLGQLRAVVKARTVRLFFFNICINNFIAFCRV